ncbi:MAG: 8-oxo-dGTP diphosphatase MutT [Rhodospirillales bacterium]|nr:8-oxo-dGTP diphosphatase MutT [Alphaproteobacteria bacterium]MCB9987246.1 8-oxo-dGTP diphosphatase MutT [Rhodospirillales bacterium]USO07893.1 MAG: 8-oxo-dGTP diphosphatase MutT [Rhodospirillales bacterium]
MGAAADDHTGCCGKPLPYDLPPFPNARVVTVVAGILIDGQNRILLAQRPAGKAMAGLWEFPGGKIEPGETPEYALVRELKDELGIITCTDCLQPLTFASHAYPDFHLLMPVFAIRKWRGEPQGCEGQKLVWATLRELDGYDMPPADRPLIPMLFDLL